jgi:hypothetical protein
MIFTHTGKLGDAVQCLPILSAYYKKTGEKPKYALAKFPFSKGVEELLRMQECIGDVIHLEYEPEHFGLGGQPYKFDLRQYYDTFEPYFNLGFRAFPDKYYGDFIAEEYCIGYDYDFRLNIGEKKNKFRGKTVILDKFEGEPMRNSGLKGEYLPAKNSLVKNLQQAVGAGSVKAFSTATALMLLLAGKNIVVYGETHLKDIHMNLVYAKLPGKATWVNI